MVSLDFRFARYFLYCCSRLLWAAKISSRTMGLPTTGVEKSVYKLHILTPSQRFLNYHNKANKQTSTDRSLNCAIRAVSNSTPTLRNPTQTEKLNGIYNPSNQAVKYKPNMRPLG